MENEGIRALEKCLGTEVDRRPHEKPRRQQSLSGNIPFSSKNEAALCLAIMGGASTETVKTVIGSILR